MDTLRAWGAEAKIAPMDRLSSDDKESWLRAPMVPELQMDWLVEMPDSYLYGPTNLAALQEFLALGEIDEDVQLINCKAGTDHRLGDLPVFQDSPHQRRSSTSTFVGTQWPSERREATDPDATSRVALLERDIIGYQKALGEWQEAYRQLRQQFVEATGHEPL
jgi:hypothetical protein